MQPKVTLYIHHGGEFVQQRGIKFYDGGKVENLFNQKLNVLSIPMLRKYVRSDLGYIGFKLYWHKNGFLFNDVNCKLLWDDSGIEELKKHGIESGRIGVYVDHASDGDEAEESAGESGKDDGREESAGKGEICSRSQPVPSLRTYNRKSKPMQSSSQP